MDDRHFNQNTALEWIETVEGEKSHVREVDLYPHLRGWVDRIGPSEIIDIGCGQGICSEKIDLNGRKYTGVEPSLFLLERAIQLHPGRNRRFVVGNAYALPFSDGYFDAAFSIAVWHLLEDKLKAACELSRILKEGGYFMIVAANPDAYDEWTSTYASCTRDGHRFEGRMRQDDGSESIDILYLHTYDEIIASLQSAHLDVQETTTFRTAISIQGIKRTARRF